MDKLAERIYDPTSRELAIFKKTHEQWGGYSNMASGYPLIINDIKIRSSEALYQALKYTDYPEIQLKILEQTSPMTAKMIAKPFKEFIRPDFEVIKIRIMKWCVYTKLLCNYEKFSYLLLESENKMIVEESRRDNFWGAKRTLDNKLIGINVLGRILMEARENLKKEIVKDHLLPFQNIDNFKLIGKNIEVVHKLNEPILIQKCNEQPRLL
jgi:ribA/ribD-fused uncharacterized protein